MDDVGFREHRAATRQARHARGARHQLGVAVERQSQALHLVFEEASRAGRAALVHGELRRGAVGEARHEHARLRAHLDDAPGTGSDRANAAHKRRHVFEHASARQQGGHHVGTAAGGEKAAARIKRKRGVVGCAHAATSRAIGSNACRACSCRQLIQHPAQARQRRALMRAATHREHGARSVHRHQLHRRSTDIDTNVVHASPLLQRRHPYPAKLFPPAPTATRRISGRSRAPAL